MKSLSQFIIESQSKAESSKKEDTKQEGTKTDNTENNTQNTETVTFDLNGIDGGSELVSSIRSICSSASIPADTSNLNTGVKITCSSDKEDELEKIAELVQEFISGISSEDHDDIQTELSKLSVSLDKLNDILDEYND